MEERVDELAPPQPLTGVTSPPPVAAAAVLAGTAPAVARRFPPPALRIRAFRWYWFSQWPVLLGTWMQVVALGYLVYQQTHSTAAVGVVAAADGLPAIIMSPAGGVVADRMTRRRLLLVTQSVLGLSAGVLAVLVATHHASFAAIVAVSFVFGAADAMDLPTRQALIADLVERELLVSAVALGSVVMSATRIVGPSVAGLLIALAGPAACFGTLSLAYIVPIGVLLTVIPDIAPVRRQGSTALGDMVTGMVEVRRNPLVRGSVICAGILSFFGVSYMPYLPVLASVKLHAGPQVLGLLYSTGGVGGLIGGVLLATMGRGGRRRLLLGGGVVYGISLFTLSHSVVLALSLPALVGISFGFLAMNTSMTTLLQTETDPTMRGRMMGIYAMIFAGLQPLGTLLYGVVGRFVPLFDAISVGAVIVGVTAVLTGMSRAFRSLGSA